MRELHRERRPCFEWPQNARALTDHTGTDTDTYVYTAFGEEKA